MVQVYDRPQYWLSDFLQGSPTEHGDGKVKEKLRNCLSLLGFDLCQGPLGDRGQDGLPGDPVSFVHKFDNLILMIFTDS